MNDQELNDRIVSRGKEFFDALEGEEPSLHFMDPRMVTENTMRRGFTPDTR